MDPRRAARGGGARARGGLSRRARGPCGSCRSRRGRRPRAAGAHGSGTCAGARCGGNDSSREAPPLARAHRGERAPAAVVEACRTTSLPARGRGRLSTRPDSRIRPPKPTRRGRTRSVTPGRTARRTFARIEGEGRRPVSGTRSAARARCPCAPRGPPAARPGGHLAGRRASARPSAAASPAPGSAPRRSAARRRPELTVTDGRPPARTVRRCLPAAREHRAQAPAAARVAPVRRAADERRDRRRVHPGCRPCRSSGPPACACRTGSRELGVTVPPLTLPHGRGARVVAAEAPGADDARMRPGSCRSARPCGCRRCRSR